MGNNGSDFILLFFAYLIPNQVGLLQKQSAGAALSPAVLL